MSFTQHMHDTVNRVDALLQDHISSLPNHAPKLKDAMQYALLNGGKRMRPTLAYAVSNMLEVNQKDTDVIAMAIECVHAYSLVHDDLPAMDDDDLRRGNPTCHIAFDEATAILAGDALQTLAFELIVEHPMSKANESKRLELVKILANSSGYIGMCGGQAMDLAATDTSIEQTQLELLQQKKTGALLKAAIHMPCVLTENLPSEAQLTLLSFADKMGLAFQVQDDILDVVGDSHIMGKPQGADEALHKSTFPSLLGLEGAKQYLTSLHTDSLQALASLPYNTQLLHDFADYMLKRDH